MRFSQNNKNVTWYLFALRGRFDVCTPYFGSMNQYDQLFDLSINGVAIDKRLSIANIVKIAIDKRLSIAILTYIPY